MEYEYLDDNFEQSGGGMWIRVLGIVVYLVIILAFAWQTLELVSWLFVDENWYMKAVTVFVCDGCASGYAMAEMFYRFRLRWSKNIVFGMWLVTFASSTLATIIQMYLSSTNRIPHNIDPGIITIAYGIVIAMFVVNIIAITVVIRMEYNASQPKRIYMDDKEYRKRHQRVRIVEQAPAAKLVTANPSRDHVVDPHRTKKKIETERIETKAKKKESNSKLFDFSLPYDETSITIEMGEGEIEEREPQTQTDLMAMDIDQRWNEYSKTNATEQPKKKGRVTRREVIGLGEG